MDLKDKEIAEWIARVKGESVFEVPKLTRAEVGAFNDNRNTPFTWEKVWPYVVNRVRGLKPMQTRKFMDAQFSPRQTGEDFLEFGLLFNNPDVIQAVRDAEAFQQSLDRYFEQVTFNITNFEDQSKDESSHYSYFIAVLLTFK